MNKQSKITSGLLLLALLVALVCYFLSNPASSLLPVSRHPISTTTSAPLAQVEPPKLPPAPAASTTPASALKNSSPGTNDFGDINFTDGVSMNFTLSSGEAVIITAKDQGEGTEEIAISIPGVNGGFGSTLDMPEGTLVTINGLKTSYTAIWLGDTTNPKHLVGQMRGPSTKDDATGGVSLSFTPRIIEGSTNSNPRP